MRQNTAQNVAATLRGLAARPDRSADLSAILCPTLVIVGSEDAITPPDEARGMARAIPRCEFVEVEGGGHLAPMERPDAVNQAIMEFLGKAESPREPHDGHVGHDARPRPCHSAATAQSACSPLAVPP